MADFTSPSAWALDRFDRAAQALLQLIPGALRAAHGRARAAHVGSGLESNDAYGGTLWLIQHEELVVRADTVGTASVIRPPGGRYSLLVVNGVVLYPWRYASDRTTRIEDARLREPVSELRRNLFRALAPAVVPMPDPTLFDVEDEGGHVAETADQVAAEPVSLHARLVLIAYASNPHGGILAAEWGDASLLDDGRLRWDHREPLPLQPPQEGGAAGDGNAPTGPSAPLRPVPPTTKRRFDAAPLEEPPLGRQTPGVIPTSEPTPTPPETGSDERS